MSKPQDQEPLAPRKLIGGGDCHKKKVQVSDGYRQEEENSSWGDQRVSSYRITVEPPVGGDDTSYIHLQRRDDRYVRRRNDFSFNFSGGPSSDLRGEGKEGSLTEETRT